MTLLLIFWINMDTGWSERSKTDICFKTKKKVFFHEFVYRWLWMNNRIFYSKFLVIFLVNLLLRKSLINSPQKILIKNGIECYFFCIIQSSNFLWNFLQKMTPFFKFARELGEVQNFSSVVVGWYLFFYPFFSFPTQFPRLHLAFGLASLRTKQNLFNTDSVGRLVVVYFCKNIL